MATTFETVSGKLLDPSNIDPCLVCVDDIATHLSRIFRFNGATVHTVAEHAVHCAQMAAFDGQPVDIQYACLHHDSHEYIFGDVTSGVKKLCPDYLRLEKLGQLAVLQALGVTWTPAIEAIVKRYDQWGARVEAGNLMPSMGEHWGTNVPDCHVRDLVCLGPNAARRYFLQAHEQLWRAL